MVAETRPNVRRWLLKSLAGLVIFGCGPAAAPVPTAQFAQAHSTAQNWWLKAEAAFISGDPNALGDLFAGSALDVATGELQMLALANGLPKYPRPFRDSTVFAPGPGKDPTWFLTIIRYAPVDRDGRAQAIDMFAPGMIFNQVNGTWKVIATDVQAPIGHDYLPTKEFAFSTPLDDSRYLMARSAIASIYATYLNSLSAGQQPEVPFPSGLNSFAWQITHVTWPPGSIATAHWDFKVDTAQVVVYSITSGITKAPEVVVFVIRRTVIFKPRQGCLVRRPGDSWSAIVPPGSYSAVTIASVSVVAATVPFNDGDTSQGRKVIDISAGIDDVSATGTKC